MLRSRRRASFSNFILCLVITYSLLLSGVAPFTFVRAKAAPEAKAGANLGGVKPGLKAGGKRAGELLVRFRQNTSNEEKNTLTSSRGGRRERWLRGESRVEKLKFQEGQDVEALAADLRLNPNVELVEPNYLVTKDDAMPDDTRFSEQWALKNTGSTGGQIGADISAPAAWATTTGSPSTVVAVIDSGIDFSHPDLKNNRWTNQSEKANNRDDDRDSFTDDLYGWDWVSDTGVIRDEQGHGTTIAGIIAAEGNNAAGVSGVMWHASLMSLRVLDNVGTGDVASAVEAIDYAVAHGAQVINCSWGTDQESTFLRDAIERAGKKGVIVVASAGNDGKDLEALPYYPAAFGLSNLISVGSTDQFDQLASFSNYGSSRITIAAPGTGILTTQMGGGYRLVTGTSASAPLVSGVAGLVKTVRPFLSAAGTKLAVTEGVRRISALEGRVTTGGVVSAAGALASLRGPGNPPTPNGNGMGNGGGRGNSGSNGQQSSPRPPATPPRGTGGTGRDGGFSVDPPARTTTLPGGSLPNLDEVRKQQNSVPKGPSIIRANLPCADCDPSGGGGSGGGYYPVNDPLFSTARLQPRNETGRPNVDLGSQNFNWSLPLLGLKGRSGLDLSLTLYYNSLVWTRAGSYIKYNADHGSPAPGFRLGMPFIQPRYYNSEVGVWAYMMVTPSGGRIEMRQVNGGTTYESADSSYTQLTDNTTSALVRTKDGMQYNFVPVNSELRCNQIKDRNGNYITISYDGYGKISTITDTLGRVVNFNYAPDNNLQTITQTWGSVTHTWATFYYGSVYIQPSFGGLYINGPNNEYRTVLTTVVLDDGTYYSFDYSSFGQVWKIRSYAADGHLRNYVSYNLPGNGTVPSGTQTDCPRFTERRNWAENWNGGNEAATYYSVSADGSWSQEIQPDGAIYKEFFYTSGWQKGLPYLMEVHSEGVRRKWTTMDWTQDNTNLTYQLNPRPYDISNYDEAGNRRRTDILYHSSYGLPWNVREYATDGTTIIRQTYTDYRLDQAYITHHIIGLVSAVHVVGVNGYESKITYDYDWGGNDYWKALPTTATQHDTSGDNTGRGNLCMMARWDITDINNFDKTTRSYIHYNRTGSVIRQEDHYGHGVNISYTDSFSDGTNRDTFAYPTTVTDADNFSWTTRYNFNIGAITRSEDPKGAVKTFQYDAAGRIEQVTNQANSSYIRWVYNPYGDVATFTTNQIGASEFFQVTYFDGAGRLRSRGGDNPGSAGGYYGQFWIYDKMGRLSQYTNPAEINSSWAPSGDDAAGWTWTSQTYDWQGRPLLTTSPDGSTRENSYSGCGCAGGDQITTRDERGRRKRLTMDVLGRLKQVEELNWNQSVYSTTTYSYNARDQITSINQAGLLRSFDYDGYGRLWHRTTPEQGTTTYTYNLDDTVNTVTDARGSVATLGYNNRHMPTSVNYYSPPGVAPTSNLTYGYDAVGNRTSMTDGLGSVSYVYNTLSQMTSETRTFTELGSSYTLSYTYNLYGQLTGITNPWGAYIGYNYDKTGRVTGVSGSGYSNVSTYASNLQYRAFGGLKAMTYGNNLQLNMQYDTRMRLTRWDMPNIPNGGMYGYQYSYSILADNSYRVSYAQNLYDSTLNRSYDYDHRGRLEVAHSGNEADAHVGQGNWGQPPTGPYSHHYGYDQFGNLNYRAGWGGTNPSYSATFTNNRLPWLTYDASGNMIDAGGGWTFQYDATGQQTYSAAYNQQMAYDGNRLRGKKTVNGVTTYYLRSSMLGGQVVAELTGAGAWARGYVYLGSQLLAIQSGGVYWMHSDPITKGERVTSNSGTIVSAIELDPWGGETSRMTNSAFQTRWYTSYERDENGSYEAMNRRYNRWWSRFEQPDPWDGSYDISDPQSFNRYAYAQNDPVNFIDPLGLCTFNINLTIDKDSFMDPAKEAAMKQEIERIFAAAGQQVVFNNPGAANGGSYNINISLAFPSSVERILPRDRPGIVGYTNTTRQRTASNQGYVATGRLSAEIGMVSAQEFGVAAGRVVAHEAGHFFLQLLTEDPAGSGIMGPAEGYALRDPAATGDFNFSQFSAETLSSKCPKEPPPGPLPHHGGGGGGGGLMHGGGGGRNFGGGFYPAWYADIRDFLNWVWSTTTETMDNSRITVCSGGVCM